MEKVKGSESEFSYEDAKAMFAVADGELRRRTTRGGEVAGKKAGTLKKDGYTSIYVCGKFFQAHRVVWLLTYGNWPQCAVDHINGNRSDNRVENLRLCSLSQNQWNKKAATSSSTGLKGVVHARCKTRFIAQIYIGGKPKYLGTFHTAKDAAHAYDKSCLQNFGDFARPNFPKVSA